MKHYTRFRAYQLGEEGSSFSLIVDNQFTLIEAKITDTNLPNIKVELNSIDKKRVDVLHITSWDTDHCDDSSLDTILTDLKPLRIEFPSYLPDSDTGKKCLKMINNYIEGVKVICDTSMVADSIMQANVLRGIDIFFNPIKLVDKHNDNSNVKFFRVGSFQILSLGDCESEEISIRLQDDKILQSEVDVLILAHHGSENSICTTDFLKKISPKVAICSSNYDNKFEHPHQVIRNRLSNLQIPCYTTKTGDVIIESIDKYNFQVFNFCSNNGDCKEVKSFKNKTYYIND